MAIQTIDAHASLEVDVLRAEMRKAVHVIAGKWKLEILWMLNQHTRRFGELKKALPGVTQHMLTAQLRELEADGLITRRVFAEVPPRVEYTITEAARGLQPVMAALAAWWSVYKRGAGRGAGGEAPEHQ